MQALKGLGKVRKERGKRWCIQLRGGRKIYCDKNHMTFYSEEHAMMTLVDIAREGDSFDADFYSKRRKSLRSFSYYAEQWLADLEIRKNRGELSPGYVRRLRGYYHNHWEPHFGTIGIAEIRGKDISSFYLRLDAQPKTRRNIIQALKKLFRDAWADEVIEKVPRFPKPERIPQKLVPWATKEQQHAILDCVDNPIARYILSFCVAHGCRIGEARALQHGDIDLERDTVTIRRAFSGKDLRPHPKGKRDRVIPLDSNWKSIYLSKNRGLPQAFVFNGNRGKPCGQNFGYRHWRAACNKVGFQCTQHQGTRHSKLTQLALAGVPKQFIQMFAGHEDGKTTDRYIHMTDVEALRLVLQQAEKGNVVELRRKKNKN